MQKICIRWHRTFQGICKNKDDTIFQLCFGSYGNIIFFEIAIAIIASLLLCIIILFVKELAIEANLKSNEAIKP
jgi:hypothetical protein